MVPVSCFIISSLIGGQEKHFAFYHHEVDGSNKPPKRVCEAGFWNLAFITALTDKELRLPMQPSLILNSQNLTSDSNSTSFFKISSSPGISLKAGRGQIEQL